MRTGKIPVNNVSGGEVTSAPLLETPQKYSRLLQNFYINSEGHIKKVPGFSAASAQISNVRIASGIDFKKQDGTSIILAGGRNGSAGAVYRLNTGVLVPVKDDFGSVLPMYFSQIADQIIMSNGVDLPLVYNGTDLVNISMPFDVGTVIFTGTGLNDLAVNVTASGEVEYKVEIDQEASDTITPSYDAGTGINDLSVPNPNYVGATASSDFDVAIDGVTAGTTEDGVYLEDNFDDNDISNWTVIDGIWGATGGQLYNGVSGAGGGGRISIASAMSVGTWDFKGQITSTTHNSYIEFYFMSSASDLTSGNGYFLQFIHITSTNQTWVSLWKRTGETTAALTGNHVIGGQVTSLNSFRVTRATGGNFAVYLNGAQILTATDNSHTSSSYFGVRSSPNPAGGFPGVNYFDDFLAWDPTEIAANHDTIKYNLNGGIFVENEPLTTLREGLAIAGVLKIKASNSVGHLNTDYYEIKIFSNGTPDKFQWRKNGGAWSAETDCVAYPYYTELNSEYSIAFISTTGNPVNDVYYFQVDGAVTPDTFKWRKDAGAYTETVDIVAGPMSLGDEGISAQFSHFTGHAVDDVWSFTALRDTYKYYADDVEQTTGNLLTDEYTDLVAGVQVKFTSLKGHTLGDYWTIPISQSVRFGKSYTYKNRVWLIGSDKLTAYYSNLALPTDFVNTGAGYIDFRYVIPSGDEMVDISSVLNYLAFFFKNHIVVYSGSDPTASGDFAVYQTLAGVGAVAPNVVVPVGSDVFFLSDKGVKGLKQILNTGALNISNVSAAIDQDIVDAIKANASGVYGSAHYPKYGLVLFLIGTTIFVFNYRNNAWSRIILPTANDASKVLSMFSDSEGNLYMGGYDYLFRFDPATATYNFNGQAPEYKWKTGLFQVTTADSLYFTELLLRLASFSAATLTVKARAVGYDTEYEDQSAFNEQTIQIDAKTPSDIITNFARAPLFGAGKYIQLEITEAPAYTDNNDVEIIGMEISGEIGSV